MQNSFDNEFLELQKKEPRRRGGRFSVKIVALCMACFILGAVISAGLMAYRTTRLLTQYAQEAQQRIDDTTSQAQALVDEAQRSLLAAGITPVALENAVAQTQNEAAASGAGEPVVAIADACKPCIVGVTNQIDQATYNSGQYSSDIYEYYRRMFPGIFGGADDSSSQTQEDSTAKEPEYVDYAFGSGVIIDAKNGYIITNNHVIDGASKIVITLYNDTQVEAELVGTDEYSDVALLKLVQVPQGLTQIVIGNSDNVTVGEMAVAIGNPLGKELIGTVTMGVISATDREIELDDGRVMRTLQTDAAINSGNSGGALLNAKGELIGITTLKMSSSSYSSASIEGLGFAIPVNEAMLVADELKANGRVVRPALGISCEDISAAQASQTGVVQGVRVRSITSGSSAYGKLEVMDIITAWNGEAITTRNQLQNKLNHSKVGDTVTLSVFREGKTMDIAITLQLNAL